jgi:hypothetical protein
LSWQRLFALGAQADKDVRDLIPKKLIDEFALLFYYSLNTGREVIKKYMSSNHSEVAET